MALRRPTRTVGPGARQQPIPKPSAPPRAAATVGPLQTLSPAARSGPPEERLGVSVTCSATVIRVLGA